MHNRGLRQTQNWAQGDYENTELSGPSSLSRTESQLPKPPLHPKKKKGTSIKEKLPISRENVLILTSGSTPTERLLQHLKFTS